MTRMLTTLAVLCLLPPACAQEREVVAGSGKIATESRELAEFDEIELHISGNVYVKIGKQTPVKVQADDNILPLIVTAVRNGRLVITAETGFTTKHQPEIKVTVANLKAAELLGSGDMHVSGIDNRRLSIGIMGSGDMHVSGKTGQLALSISGSGDAHVSGSSEQFKLNIAGSGDAHLSGKARQLTLTVGGSGDVQGHDLETRDTTITITGSGDANVSVVRSLDVTIMGSGDVTYAGDPKVHTTILGTGDVKRRG